MIGNKGWREVREAGRPIEIDSFSTHILCWVTKLVGTIAVGILIVIALLCF